MDFSAPRICILTLSDSVFKGEKEDTSGPLLACLLKRVFPDASLEFFLLPDEADSIRTLVAELAKSANIIATTGGTGPGPRDVTPEAVLPLLHKRFAGMEQLMMAASLAITPKAALSRLVAGAIGGCLLLCLPGSAKAVEENLTALVPVLPHTLEKLGGDDRPCGGHVWGHVEAV